MGGTPVHRQNAKGDLTQHVQAVAKPCIMKQMDQSQKKTAMTIENVQVNFKYNMQRS